MRERDVLDRSPVQSVGKDRLSSCGLDLFLPEFDSRWSFGPSSAEFRRWASWPYRRGSTPISCVSTLHLPPVAQSRIELQRGASRLWPGRPSARLADPARRQLGSSRLGPLGLLSRQ